MVIALVENDRNLSKALGRLLMVFGYNAELFASGEEFLNSAATSKADCVIVDMQLGDMSGLKVMRQLSQIGLKFPVICMSGSVQDKFRKEALAMGCEAYLQKPFDPALLIAAVDKATGTKRAAN